MGSSRNTLVARARQATGATLLKVVVTTAVVLLIVGRISSTLVKEALDATGLTLLALAVVPWLGPVFESIKVAGVEAKFRDVDKKLRLVEATAQEAKGISADAGQKANLALGSALPSRGESNMDATSDGIGALVDEYEEIRLRMPSGSLRTQRMAGVVSRMMDRFGGRADPSADLYLSSNRIGERLAAYAYCMTRPVDVRIERLVDVVATEDKPFNQYWGLQAIARALSTPTARYDRAAVEGRLRGMREQYPPGTDRRFVTDQILSSLSDRQG